MATQEPISAAQLQAARSAAWHQTGDPLSTGEAAREWLTAYGLVLFAPRAQQLGAPAPSLVEATLGSANDAPSLAQIDTARSLAARLVAEGHAVPLNLLGGSPSGSTDLPDFLASAQVFSFLYTLRGDKLWKQPPATSGANKVTPLALSVYEMLAERGAMSASDLAGELGRELTESAVARALSELWQHMRVIPLLQQGEGATQWELTTRRFTKTIKAGTNAGQPTALSALVSLYLAQSLLAGEEEVAAFLSPVAARSRIREVLHALVAARELNELVIDGKTLLHIPGALPAFPEIEAPEAPAAEAAAEGESSQAGSEEGGNIKRFASRDELDSSAFRGKSSAAPGFRSRPAGGGFRTASSGRESNRGDARRVPRAPRREGGPPTDRERRPFRREEGAGPRPASPRSSSPRPAFPRPARSEYAKPWEEDRKPRHEAAASGDASGEARPPRREDTPGDRPFRARPSGDREARKPFGDRDARKPFADRKPFGDRGDRPARTSFGDKKPFGDRDARKPFGDGPARKPFGNRKPFGDRPAREGEDGPRRTFSAASDRPARAPRRDSAEGGKPFRPRTDSGDRPDRPFRPRSEGESRPPREGGFRPVRREGAEGRPPFRPRTEGAEGRPPFRRREEGAEGRPSRPAFRPPSGDRKPFARPRRDEGRGDAERPRPAYSGDREGAPRPRRTGDAAPYGERKGPPRAGKPFARPGPARPGFGSKPGGRPPGKFAGKRPFGKGPSKGAAKRPGRPAGDGPARRPESSE